MDYCAQVDVKVVCGQNLMRMDSDGKSDPYVKIYRGTKLLHKTCVKKNTLNPSWNENISLEMKNETDNDKIVFKVFDYDFLSNDFMGQGFIELSLLNEMSQEVMVTLEHNQDHDLIKKMKKHEISLGNLIVRVTFTDMESQRLHNTSPVRYMKESLSPCPSPKSFRSEASFEPDNLVGSVHIVLVQARGLIPTDGGDCVNAYCKLSLGDKKRKSTVYPRSPNPKWREGIDLPWYEGPDNFLEISIFDQNDGREDNDRIGRANIDLTSLDRDVSNNMWLPIKDRVKGMNSENLLNVELEGKLNVIITVSGSLQDQDGPSVDLSERENISESYALRNSLKDMGDVGILKVRILRAEGLNPEYVGHRNPFVVLDFGNTRVQTCSRKSTTEPVWNKEFNLNIADISEDLEVSVCDCNSADEYRTEFLGKVQISLFNIECGVGKWYTLKDKSMRTPAKGNSARILLEMDLVFNKIRACALLVAPKQMKYEESHEHKFDYAEFKNVASRMKNVKEDCEFISKRFRSLFAWDDPFKSFYAMLTLPLLVWNFDAWMIPFFALLLLFYKYTNPTTAKQVLEELEYESIQKEDDEKTVIEKLEALQVKVLRLQVVMEKISSRCEQIANIFNFTVPFLSVFLGFLFLGLTLILFFVPLRLLVILWLLNKFRKGLFNKSNTNNKVMNLLSRVPDNEKLKNWNEITEMETTSKKSMISLRRKASEDKDII